MKAKVYYLKSSQQDLCKELVKFLKKYIYTDITIDFIDIADQYNKNSPPEMHLKVQNYITHLKEFIPKTGDAYFYLEQEYGGYYMGTEHPHSQSSTNEVIILKHRFFSYLFPGIVIMDQLRMVPSNITEYLRRTNVRHLQILKHPHIGGPMLVDYNNPKQLSSGFEQLDTKIKGEIFHYMLDLSKRDEVTEPNFDIVSKNLDIDLSYFKKNEKEFIINKYNFSVNVSICEDLQINELTVIELNIESNFDCRNCSYAIKAPANTLKSNSNGVIDQRQRITIEVEPKTGPFIPLELSIYVPPGLYKPRNIFFLEVKP